MQSNPTGLMPDLLTVRVNPGYQEAGRSLDVEMEMRTRGHPGGTTIALRSLSPALIVPASVTVPFGQSGVQFQLQTSADGLRGNEERAQFIATDPEGGAGRGEVVLVRGPTPDVVSVTPRPLVPGQRGTVSVTLTGPAPEGGTDVLLLGSYWRRTASGSRGPCASRPARRPARSTSPWIRAWSRGRSSTS